MNDQLQTHHEAEMMIEAELTADSSIPDSFALIDERFLAIQFKKKKLICVYSLEGQLQTKLEMAMSRNGQSFCHYKQYLAIRNLRSK